MWQTSRGSQLPCESNSVPFGEIPPRCVPAPWRFWPIRLARTSNSACALAGRRDPGVLYEPRLSWRGQQRGGSCSSEAGSPKVVGGHGRSHCCGCCCCRCCCCPPTAAMPPATVSATFALCNGPPSWVPGQGKASAARKERVLLVVRSTGTLGGLLTDQRTLVLDEGAHFYSCRELMVEHAPSVGCVRH